MSLLRIRAVMCLRVLSRSCWIVDIAAGEGRRDLVMSLCFGHARLIHFLAEEQSKEHVFPNIVRCDANDGS